MQRPMPALMIPIRRCGSHQFRLRLNCSPDFYAPYPLHIVDMMKLVPLYGDLQEDRRYFEMIVDVVGLVNVSMVKWDVVFDPVKVFDAVHDKPRSIHTVVWELLFQAAEAHGARVVMDKSLDSVHYAKDLLAILPHMRFLNVVRDPRAQINSMNAAIIHEFDTYANALAWAEAHTIARELATTYPERVLTIRYEDFLAEPEPVLRKICAFLDIAFMPGMLTVSKSKEAQDIAKLSALWQSNASEPIRSNIDKYKKALSPDEIEIIETVSREFMDLYGYERMTAGRRDLAAYSLQESNGQSEKARAQAWRSLKENNYKDYVLRDTRARYLRMLEERLVEDKQVAA